MIKNIILLLGVGATLSGCNLFGGLSKPSSDPQHLLAARACLDRGDYVCAQEHYTALSDSYNDIRISEGNLTTLAQNNIFSMSDLIGALGDGRGSGSTLAALANVLGGRGKTDATTRLTIQQVWANADGITNPQTKAFSKFLAALAMYNSVLGAAVGADGVLTATDIAGSGCKALSTDLLACDAAACDPNGSAITSTSEAVSMDSSSLWSADPSMDKLFVALSAADSQLSTLTGGSGEGFLKSISDIEETITGLGLGGSAIDRCKRNVFINALGL